MLTDIYALLKAARLSNKREERKETLGNLPFLYAFHIRTVLSHEAETYYEEDKTIQLNTCLAHRFHTCVGTGARIRHGNEAESLPYSEYQE